MWSDAYTGAYRLDLPDNHTYTPRVVSDDSDCRSLVRRVTLESTDQTVPLRPPADSWAAVDDPAYALAK
ncbi:hypothetical protein [Streptomyces sp. NPDC003480]